MAIVLELWESIAAVIVSQFPCGTRISTGVDCLVDACHRHKMDVVRMDGRRRVVIPAKQSLFAVLKFLSFRVIERDLSFVSSLKGWKLRRSPVIFWELFNKLRRGLLLIHLYQIWNFLAHQF
jgi:hypothetical protein